MPIKGKVEVFSRRTVRGWIAQFGDLNQKPALEIVLDGNVLASGPADEPRPDVLERGFGDGQCQFQIHLPDSLRPEDYPRLKLRIARSDLYLEMPRAAQQTFVATVTESTVGPASPVFVVGSPRSGTSALASALMAAGYDGFAEGNLLGLSQMIEQRVDWYYTGNDAKNPRTLIGNVPVDELKAELFEVFRKTLDRLNPVDPWFDKTGNPETIQMLPRIIAAWPGCRVIFARRRGIENIMSRVIKFPERDFEYHCKDWARNMNSWRVIRGKLDQSRITEVDQREMAVAPEAVTVRLTNLLNLDDAAANRMAQVFRAERPQETFSGSAERVLDLAKTGWTDAQKQIFLTSCGAEMEAYGYTDDNIFDMIP